VLANGPQTVVRIPMLASLSRLAGAPTHECLYRWVMGCDIRPRAMLSQTSREGDVLQITPLSVSALISRNDIHSNSTYM